MVRPAPNPLVIIVGDDAAIRASLDSLFRSIGLEARLFSSPSELLGGSVRTMKVGAVDFLSKPFRDQDMLDAVTLVLARDT